MNILNIEFGWSRTLTAMISYITDVELHTSMHTINPIPYITGFGVNPNTADKDMLAIKEYYGKTQHRPYWHIEVSVENTKYTTSLINAFFNIGYKLYEWSGCQLIMAIHTNTYWKNNCIHCHYVLNSVRISGTMLTLNKYSSKAQIEELVNKVLAAYEFGPVNIPHNQQLQNCY